MGCSWDARDLKKVTFLGPVTSIEESAFMATKSLKHIDLPESLTYLGGSAFALFFRDGEVRSGGLEEITIPASISKIEDSTFSGCCDLKSVSFLGPVTSIGNSAFYGTTSLQDINLPESVCTIGTFAFARTNFQKIRFQRPVRKLKMRRLPYLRWRHLRSTQRIRFSGWRRRRPVFSRWKAISSVSV